MHSVEDRCVAAGDHGAIDLVPGAPAIVASSFDRPPVWPEGGDVAVLHRRSAVAAELLTRGRHAPGVRQLRQTIGAWARRRDWRRAGHDALVLASGLLARGAPRAAQSVIEEATRYAEQAGSAASLVDIAILSGHAWIDLARLDRAETVVRAAHAAALAATDSSRATAATLAFARCLFWKGGYTEAASIVAPAGPGIGPGERARLLASAARAAIGQGEASRALSLVHDAGEAAATAGDPALLALVSCAAALVHLVVDDLDAADTAAQACLAAARLAHHPMRALRARLVLAESERRRGRTARAAALVRHLRQVGAAHLPAILRARVELVAALVDASASPVEVATRLAGQAGLPALRLWAIGQRAEGRAPTRGEALAEETVGILRACQAADDEAVVIGDVCARLRRQLRAAGVAVFARDGATCRVVAFDGSRVDVGTAERAVADATAIALRRLPDRLEGTVLVRYGDAVIGALAARWPVGTSHDPAAVCASLSVAATAVAPVMSAALGRLPRPADAVTGALIGGTAPMVELRRTIGAAAAAPFAVLVEGESGSGKELVARAIHGAGPRKDRPFCTLNCAALPDDLVEAELFGHARGAFTGAVAERAGVFEDAHGGTLLLDEVGELSLRAQAKLLRVIQEGELRRVGENASRRVDVRVVSATNRDLRQEVAAGRFRLDLLYRLDVIRIVVPALRDRAEDVAVLADHFWREATARVGSRAVLSAATSAALARYDWPGNVRELQNVLAALAVRAPRRGVVEPGALPPQFGVARRGGGDRLGDARRMFEERFVRAALARCGGHRSRAAAELGVTRQGLAKLMARLGIDDRRLATTG